MPQTLDLTPEDSLEGQVFSFITLEQLLLEVVVAVHHLPLQEEVKLLLLTQFQPLPRLLLSPLVREEERRLLQQPNEIHFRLKLSRKCNLNQEVGLHLRRVLLEIVPVLKLPDQFHLMEEDNLFQLLLEVKEWKH
jgi:hypothetical protein